MVEIQVAAMLAARRLLLDSPMNSINPKALSPHPSDLPGGNSSTGWSGQGNGKGAGTGTAGSLLGTFCACSGQTIQLLIW